MTLVSIIILTFEQPDFFFETLDSVLNQDVNTFNLIIIDDCSSKNYFDEEIIENYIKNNNHNNLDQVTIKKSKQNFGTVKTLNIALDSVKTPYYFVVGGDDLLPTNAISSLLNFACKSNYDCVGGHIYSFTNIENPVYEHITNYLSTEKIERLNSMERMKRFREIMLKILESPSIVGSILKTKTINLIGGYDERYVLYEDTPLLIKLLLNDAKFGFIDETTYHYRIGDGITSNTNNPGYPLLMKDYIALYEYLDNDEFLSKALNAKKMILKHKLKYQYLLRHSLCEKGLYILVNLPKIFRYFILDKVVRFF